MPNPSPRSPLRRGCEMTTICPICQQPQNIDVTTIGDPVARQVGEVCRSCRAPARKFKPVLGEHIGPQVLQALGIQVAQVTKLSLHFEVGRPVVCRVESFADGAAIERLAKVLQDFELVKSADPQAGG